MQTEMLTPSEKEQAREALQRAEIRADWIRTHLKAAGEGQVTENLEAELDTLSREQFMLRTLLQPPVAPTGHRLIPVRQHATCGRCRSSEVAYYRTPRTNSWHLHEIVRHASSTVSGVYLDIDQPHRCAEVA
jgi:hypothetical protein